MKSTEPTNIFKLGLKETGQSASTICTEIFSFQFCALLTNPFHSGKWGIGKNADPDQMPHNMKSDPGLHYFPSCSAICERKCLIEHNLAHLYLKMDPSKYMAEDSFSIKVK